MQEEVKEDSKREDALDRVLEASQLAKLLLSLYDELRLRKFSKEEAINISERNIVNFMSYKSNMTMIEQGPQGGSEIIFVPEDGQGPHNPGCQHA